MSGVHRSAHFAESSGSKDALEKGFMMRELRRGASAVFCEESKRQRSLLWVDKTFNDMSVY